MWTLPSYQHVYKPDSMHKQPTASISQPDGKEPFDKQLQG